MSLPSDLLHSGSTRLRALERKDIEAMARWENDPSHWLVTGTAAPYSREALDALCAGHQDLYSSGQLRWIVEDAGTVCGAVDLYDFHARDARAGVGILIDPAHRGQGIAGRALDIAVRHATHALLLHGLHAEVHADHSHSLGLFESAGFTAIGRRKEWTRTPEGWMDVVLLQNLLGNP